MGLGFRIWSSRMLGFWVSRLRVLSASRFNQDLGPAVVMTHPQPSSTTS